MACKDTTSYANLRSIVGRRKEANTSGPCSSAATSYAASSSGESDCGTSPPSYAHSHTRSLSHSFVPSEVQVEVDTVASSSHTLFTLHCKDRKGLLYDLFLNLKEVDVRVAFGKLDVDPETEECTADLYVQDSDLSPKVYAKLVLGSPRQTFTLKNLSHLPPLPPEQLKRSIDS